MIANSELEVNEKDCCLDPSQFDDQKIIQDYNCGICGLVPYPKKAVEETECGHVFCKECLDRWISTNSTCPFCRKDAKNSRRPVVTQSKILYRLLMNMKIKCPASCSWSGPWSELNEHLSTCPDAILVCRYKCGYKAARSFMINHETNECPKRLVDCTFCSKRIRLSNMQEHLKSCKNSAAVFPCKYSTVGCTFKGNQLERLAHEANSGNMHLELAMKYIEAHKDDLEEIKEKYSKKRVYKLGCSYKVGVHPHLLKFVNEDNGWGCDGRKLPGGCKSGITGFRQTQGMNRYRCKDCDYDLCQKCLDSYIMD